MRVNRNSALFRYGCAAVCMVFAIAIRRLLEPVFAGKLPFAFPFLAILVTAWIGGLGPALVTVALGLIGIDYFLPGPRGTPEWTGYDALATTFYCLNGAGVAMLGGLMHKARWRAEASAAETRAANALLESRVRERMAEIGDLRAALDEHAIVSITDPQGRITHVNEKFCSTLQYSRSELIGQDHRILSSGHHAKEFIRELWTTIQRGGVWKGEFQNRAKDGSLHWVETTILPFIDLEGRIRQFMAISADITERKRAEAAFRESEELFSKAFRLSPDCVVIVRLADLTVIRANDALCQLWGSSPEEVIGKPGRDFSTWLSAEERSQFMRTLNERGECLNYETILRLADGRLLNFNISSRLISFNAESCALSVMRDITERRRAEELAARLAAIVQTSDDAIIGKDLNGVVTSWNAGAEHIFGYSAGEMLDQPIRRLIPPDRLGEEVDILDRVRRGENIRHLDTVRVRKDGRLIDVSITTSAIKDSSGKIIGASKVARDITERKQAERELRQREEEFRTLAEAMPQIVWTTTAEGKNVYCSQRWMDYTGLTLEESLGDGWNKPFHPDDKDRAWAAWQKAVATQGQYSIECRLRRTDGVYRWWWILGAPLRGPDGAIVKWFGTCTDITERRQAVESLREREEQLRLYAAHSPAAIAMFDRNMIYLVASQRWLEDYKLQDQNIVGRSHYEVFPEIPQRWKDIHQRCLAGAVERCDEDAFPRANGTTDWIHWQIRPWHRADGGIGGIIVFSEDISARKQAQEEVRKLTIELERRVTERTAQLEASNKELEAFSYSISHDLRAPLRAINGFANIIQADFGPQMAPEARGYLERIRQGGLRMGALIDDLLAFSRLNRQSLDFKPVDVKRLVKTALAELKPQRDGRRIDLRIGELPACRGDEALLKQVWVNLISNAVKYTQKRDPAVIEIGSLVDQGVCTYFVRDNGAGFDMQYANKLFGVFQRLHRADEFEGTGVGLAIVQRIVHRHGGRVWADAKPNQGATFSFILSDEEHS